MTDINPASDDIVHHAYLGDMVRSFRLPLPMVLELERKTGAGFGALAKRMFNSEFGISEITETIRLALIGGGTPPERAAELVATYVNDRPLSETYPLAVDILRTRWFGSAKQGDQ